MNLLDEAKHFAKRAYKGKLYNNKPFYYHPYEVYKIIKLLLPDDYELQTAALLHDILEDTPITPVELNGEFGPNITNLVLEVTKNGYNSFPNLKTRRGIILKFADRLSNLANMSSWNVEKQQKYIEKSKFWV